jgi:hypothetical protein
MACVLICMKKLRIMYSLRKIFISQQKFEPRILRADVASADTSVLSYVCSVQFRMKPAVSNKDGFSICTPVS